MSGRSSVVPWSVGEPTDFETAFVDASGHLRGVRVQHLPLRDGDTIVGVLTLAFDGRRRQPRSSASSQIRD